MATSRVPARLLGRRYRLLALLGRGGMGRVWHAHDELLDREVAVKEVVLPPELSDEEREILCQRTMREARAAARLNHPNIVMVYDIVEDEGRPWIVMEFVRSRSLAQAVREDGPLPPWRVAEIGLQVLAALGVAHAAGVLHRDVKPGNVLLREDGRAVLTDFGIASLEGDPSLTKSEILLGAPAYIAPERVQGHHGRPESDLWSLAATLYTAVEGRPPYDCGAPMPTLAAVVTQEPASPKLAGPLWPVLEGMLRKDPARRTGPADAQRLLRRVASAAAEKERSEEQHPPPAAADATASVERVERTRVLPLSQAVPKPGPDPGLVAALTPRAPVALESETAVQEEGQEEAREEGQEPQPVAEVPTRADRHARLLAGLAALVVLAGAFLGWSTLRPTESHPTVQPPSVQPLQRNEPAESLPASEMPAAPTAPNTEAAPEGAASPAPGITQRSAAPPRGFHWHHDDTGFSVAVPNEWRVDRQGQHVYFREPGGSRFLLIDQTDDPKDDAVADWQEQESYRRDTYTDYRRIRIAPVDYYQEAADWEFTYTGHSGRRVHVLNRGVVTDDDKGYGIYWSTGDDEWSESLRYFEVFTETFRPAR
ncbi:MAG: protein kinase domain-containing protein [Egibacteraceae bacterium]